MAKPTPPPQDRRKLKRRNLSYYLTILDGNTLEVIGHLVDVTTIGLMVDSNKPLPTNMSFTLRLDLMENVAEKPYIEFVARCKWCRADSIQPYLFNAGFEIVEISDEDAEIVKRIAEKYGTMDSSFNF
jgi:hypothetical protein